MTQISAYIHFNGKCREAMTFYRDCIGGDLDFQTIGESPIAAQCPAGMQGQILHSLLTKGPLLLMGSDMAPEGSVQGNNIALSLNCTSELEIEECFATLSEGGTVYSPLKKEFWGATFGVFADKFGVRWMLNYDERLQTQLEERSFNNNHIHA
jgi:PhnB protein